MMSCRIPLRQPLAWLVALASLFSAALAGARAADIAPHDVKAPAAATSAVWNWSGFYVGADVGGASQAAANGRSNYFQQGAIASNLQSQAPSSSGVIGGFHLGYNWQLSHWVLGVEGDFQWTQARSSFCRETDDGPPCRDDGRGFVDVQNQIRGIGTVRGRLGYAFDRVLVYGTGGVAFADLRDTITLDCRVAGCGSSGSENLTAMKFSTVKSGWVAGVGAELMLSQNWIVRSEYLHVDVGSVSETLNLASVNCAGGGPCGASWSRSQHYDIGRVGFSYKFGGAARID